MSIKIIYYVHGTTYDNASKKCSGWKQVNLNELGKEQAINLGKNTPYKFDILFTSDLMNQLTISNCSFIEMAKINKKKFTKKMFST